MTAIHCDPNGTNINDHCGSQHTEDLIAKVREVGADVGLAFDGDGDRLIAVDEKGERITGDQIMAICGKMYKELGLLKNNLVVATVMSNFGFFAALKKLGIQEGVSKVGDRYVLEMMQEKGGVLGRRGIRPRHFPESPYDRRRNYRRPAIAVGHETLVASLFPNWQRS